jgi:NADPH:quinone reductase-like Zn-dependent oxidoreductase
MRAVAKKTRRAPAPERVPTIPKTMRAAAIDEFGGPEVLSIHTLPVPVPDANEVLIATHTTGVGRWDAAMREGWVPSGRPRFPLVLGTDGSGVVVAVGARVRRLAVGDEVYASGFLNPYGKGGFYAEFVALPASTTAKIPRGFDLGRAGAAPITGLTALQGIDRVLHLTRRETVIIHGASGGVGTLAVQFAKLRGARLFAIASGEDGVSLVRRLGADAALDGKAGGLEEAARAFAPEGFDAALLLAGSDLKAILDLVRKGGRAAYPHGVEPAPRARRGVRVIAYDGEPGAREFERLTRAIEEARLEIPISASFSLAEASRAHAFVTGHVLGKVTLEIG